MNIEKNSLASPKKKEPLGDNSLSQETQARVENSQGTPSPIQIDISNREINTFDFITQIDQRLTEAYKYNQSITIGSALAFERLNHLIENETISLETIQSITIGDENNISPEDYKKLVDNLLKFLSKNQREFKNPLTLTISKTYHGLLTIPPLQQLGTLLIGEVFGALTIESQPNLKDITAEKVHNVLKIERQNQLEELSIHYLDQQEIDIQPKLKKLTINVCSGDLSLQDQPSLETVKFERVWGLVSMNAQQIASLNNKPCIGQGMIYEAKSQAELAGPIPMDRLFTLNHLKSVVGVNKKIYILAALFEIARSTNLVNYAVQIVAEYRHLLSNAFIEQAYTSIYQFFTQPEVLSFFSMVLDPTGIYIVLGIICLYNIVLEIQRVYSNERAMMIFG